MVARMRPDLCVLTGDYMTLPGDEAPALAVLRDLAAAISAPLGTYACFGNHDTEAFKRLARSVTSIRWLEHDAEYRADLNVTFLGTSTPGDVLACVRRAREVEPSAPDVSAPPPYRILLGHEPTILMVAADLGIEWFVGGHTHGGQVRLLWFPHAPHNSSGIPGSLSSGILRCRNSICTLSRGLGESYFDVRLMCPVQIPLYRLRKGPLPGSFTPLMRAVRWW